MPGKNMKTALSEAVDAIDRFYGIENLCGHILVFGVLAVDEL